jgi:hypothetical protein
MERTTTKFTLDIDSAYAELLSGPHEAIVRREVTTAVLRTLMQLTQTLSERDAIKSPVSSFRGTGA